MPTVETSGQVIWSRALSFLEGPGTCRHSGWFCGTNEWFRLGGLSRVVSGVPSLSARRTEAWQHLDTAKASQQVSGGE